jgi:hypothetical protein
MLPEKGHNAKSGRPDPSHDATDPGSDGAAPGRDEVDPRGESAAPIRGALDPIREDHDPSAGVPDPLHDGSDPIRAVLDPRGVNLTDRGGILDPRVGSVTNVNASPDRERASPKTASQSSVLPLGSRTWNWMSSKSFACGSASFLRVSNSSSETS